MKTQFDTQPLDLNTRLKCCDGQMTADLGGELAILNLKTGVYFGLNSVGARIWSLLAETRTVREIRDLILMEYEVEPSDCERDLIKLLGELARYELVEFTYAPDHKIPAVEQR